MIEFEIQTTTLQKFFQHTSALLDEVSVEFVEGIGLRTAIVDPAHVAILDIKVPVAGLRGKGRWTFDSDDFRNLELKLPSNVAAKDRVLTCTIDDEGLLRASCRIYGRDITFEVASAELASKRGSSTTSYAADNEPKVPRLNLSSTFVAIAGDFTQAVDFGRSFSDHMTLKVAEGFATVCSEGARSKADWCLTVEVVGGEAKAMYSHDYLHNMLKSFAPATKLNVAFGNDLPLTITGRDDDGTEASYMLAPRIES